MTIQSMTDDEVLMEAEHLVAENIGNAKVKAFAREVLRLRAELEAQRGIDGYNGWAAKATRRTNDCVKLAARLATSEAAAAKVRTAIFRMGLALNQRDINKLRAIYERHGIEESLWSEALALLEEDK